MKSSNYFKFLFLFLTISVIALACAKTNADDKNESNLRSSDLKKISDWYYMGDIHNEYLMEACLNFDEKLLKSKEEGLANMQNFVKSFTPKDNRLGESLNEEIVNAMEDWTYLVPDKLKAKVLSDEISNGLTLLLTNGKIDNFEKGILTDVINLANENYSFEELNTFIDEKIVSWEAQGYSHSDNFGTYSGMVLAISKRSTEWWLSNGDCLGPNNSRWIWVATDAAGGLVGLVVGATMHELGPNADDNYDGTGAAIGGAASASLGLVGGVASGIIKLWP